MRTLIERFLAKVDIRGDDECWPWTGAVYNKGKKERLDRLGRYGRFCIENVEGKTRTRGAHKQAYMLAYGEIPDGMVVRHTCDNPICCNPKHLVLGTHKDNMDDMNTKGRCRYLSGENHGSTKFSDEQIKEIRRRCKAGESKTKLASEFSMSQSYVCLLAQDKFRKEAH